MNAEPEPGSIALERERRARELLEGWATSPALGRIERNCTACNAEWEAGQAACPKCGGNIFTERPIDPQPVSGFDRLKQRWLTQRPEEPANPQADQRVEISLERVSALAELLIEALRAADDELKRSVNEEDRPLAYGALQGITAEASSEAGDIRPGDVGRLAQVLRSLQLTIREVINPLQGVKP